MNSEDQAKTGVRTIGDLPSGAQTGTLDTSEQ